MTVRCRIVFSALYWGVEEREKRLRDTVAESLAHNTRLRLKILLDWSRGTRLGAMKAHALPLRAVL